MVRAVPATAPGICSIMYRPPNKTLTYSFTVSVPSSYPFVPPTWRCVCQSAFGVVPPDGEHRSLAPDGAVSADALSRWKPASSLAAVLLDMFPELGSTNEGAVHGAAQYPGTKRAKTNESKLPTAGLGGGSVVGRYSTDWPTRAGGEVGDTEEVLLPPTQVQVRMHMVAADTQKSACSGCACAGLR